MLEAIIDLLLSNIFFVILVIGGILSFFKRQIEKQNEQQQRPGRRPQQQRPIETRPVPARERTSSERQWKERGEKLTTDLQEMYKKKRHELKNTIQEQPSRDYVPRELKVTSPKRKPRPRPVQSQLLPNPDNVAQGVIWAEVLGPPRSRKPHSTARRRRM
ncbi:hypothetical protein [Pseudalkalibacillus salsuginis]|uniref:hypothetical protein n=1 Tax=Pseudalkalibacillus salsuginis TaxID=2910972 RepID=UPI001F3CDDBF|nr:hypothetical protein [Pseudalkalibacillus salsuginis]MCF6408533.1 hypothetical protein [Pseudalkalibacillus salsuginis]